MKHTKESNFIPNDLIWKDGLLFCTQCKEYLKESEFSANASNNKYRNFRRTICRKCYNKNQHENVKNYTDAQKLRKCLNVRLLGARDRAKNNNLYFDLTLDFLLKLWNSQKGLCALSNVPMTFELLNGRTPSNVSIDKIDHNGGYSKDNVQLVCMECNQIKSDFTLKEIYKYCKGICNKIENNTTLQQC